MGWRMNHSQASTGAGGSGNPEETECLRSRLEQAESGGRRAQSLLESVASLMGLSDSAEVMRGIAAVAARHIGFPAVSVFEADHENGQLIEVARAVRLAEDDGRSSPEAVQIEQVDPDEGPIDLRMGDPLAEFALGDQPYRLLNRGDWRGGERACLLVQMRTDPHSDDKGQRALVGVIAASYDEPDAQQTALLRSLATLGAAATEAARIERFRRQLISCVSHELRTPLAAIRAYNELLLDGDAGEINEEQREFLRRIETTCILLDRMVEDLLDLSRLRAGAMPIRRHPVDVVAVIEHIIDTLSPEAARRNISLSDEIIGDLPLISSNADRLAQVLFNLVGNAVKYTQQDGTVLVRATVCPREYLAHLEQMTSAAPGDEQWPPNNCFMIEVIDDGPGIAQEDVERIFDEFYRGRLTERSAKGSGLGLAIASRLTRLLGGVLGVESTPGKGSTFYLVFPLYETEGG